MMDEHVTIDRHTLYALGWGLIELPPWPPDLNEPTYLVRAQRKRMVGACIAYAACRGWTLRFEHGSSLQPVYVLTFDPEIPIMSGAVISGYTFRGTLQECCLRLMRWEQNPTLDE